jgi:predicted transcriptional regulator
MPVDRSMGKALRKALGVETIKFEVEPRPSGKSQLMNPRRLKVFVFLWKTPGSHIRQISRATKIPVESLKWHLGMLDKAKLIASRRFERRIAYYPRGLIRREDTELFAQISIPVRRQIVKTIWGSPKGASIDTISKGVPLSKPALRHHLTVLKNVVAIETSRVKKPVEFCPSKKFKRTVMLYKSRIPKVKDWLQTALEKDCVNPRMKEGRHGSVRIRLSLGIKKKNIEFKLNPFSYIL